MVADVATTLSALGLSSRENRAKDKIWDSLADLFKTSQSLKTAVENFVAGYPDAFRYVCRGPLVQVAEPG